MKNAILTLVTVFASFQANGRSMIAPTYLSQLDQFNFQEGTQLADSNVLSGSVSIVRFNSINLVLQPYLVCVDEVCPAMMPAPIEMDVPLLAQEIGTCNETIYTGSEDNRLVDGGLIRITVIDNSTNTCPHFAILMPTEVTLEKQSGFRRGGITTERHSMTGTTLVYTQD